jgi:hypothetical protein
MPDAVGISGDIVQVAAALAGFMLVFTGNALAGFASFMGMDETAIRGEFHKRAWLGFSGVSVAVAAVSVAALANWNGINGLAILAAFLLVGAVGCTALCAFSIVQQVE